MAPNTEGSFGDTQNIALKVTSSGDERLTILRQQLEANFAYAQQHGADFARPTNHRGTHLQLLCTHIRHHALLV